MRFLIAFLVLVGGALAPVEAQLPGPRPTLAASADTNDWEAYFDHGVAVLRRRADIAEAAFHWATRLDPSRSEPYFAAWVAFWMQNGNRWERYLDRDRRVLEQPAVRAADSLRYRAFVRSPFVHQGLEILLYDRRPGRWRQDDLTQGWIAYANADFGLAVDRLGRGIARDPERFVYVRWMRAQAFVGLRQYDSARVELEVLRSTLERRDATELLHTYESKEMIDYALGILLEAQRRRPAAREAFGRALAENLAFAPVHLALADVAVATGDRATALSEYEMAIQLDPADPVVHHRHGVALLRFGQAEAASAALRRAVELAPFYADPWFDLGRALAAHGRRDEAETALRTYLARARRVDSAKQRQAREMLAGAR